MMLERITKPLKKYSLLAFYLYMVAFGASRVSAVDTWWKELLMVLAMIFFSYAFITELMDTVRHEISDWIDCHEHKEHLEVEE